MPAQTREQQLLEEIEKRLTRKDRYVPMFATFRIWRRGSTQEAEPQELLHERYPAEPRWYGGLWDGLLRGYVAGAEPLPGQVVEFPCSEDQAEIIALPPGHMRVMVLAGPGSGKTRVLSLRQGVKKALQRPNGTWLWVGATGDRVDVLWDDLIDTIQSRAPHWFDGEPSRHGGVVRFRNGAEHIFKAAKEPSKAMGTPLQGISADGAVVDETQNVHDRAQMDIDERGRRAGTAYEVLETATNVDGLGHFARRRKEYEANPHKRIFRFSALRNPFIDPGYWARFRDSYTDRDWRQRILAEDVPSELLTYPSFAYEHTLRRRPRAGDAEYEDVTAEMCGRTFGVQGARFILGQDFGVLTTVTEVLKAFRHKPTRKIHWWAIGELTSGSHTTTEAHGRKIVKNFSVEEILVIADPHPNSKDVDKSDYEIFRRLGINIVRAAIPNTVRVKHRVTMFNVLLCNSVGERRFFIDVDQHGQPACPKLVESLITQEKDELGNPEKVRKNYADPTHWPCAAQYGVMPWEAVLGAPLFPIGGGDGPLDPLVREAMEINARRLT